MFDHVFANMGLSSRSCAIVVTAFLFPVNLLSIRVSAQPETVRGGDLLAELSSQIDVLNDPSYRKRQLARWRLQRNPRQTIVVIRDRIDRVNHNAGAQLVDLLTVFATQSDIALSLEAMELLQDTADGLSSVGQLAKNSLSAISDLQEEQAIEILLQNDAYIGPRTFKLNSQVGRGDEISLHINDRFSGDAEAIQWIRFLKSVETIYLEGDKVNREILEAISNLNQVKNLKLRHVNMQAEDLRLLSGFENLQHLGLNYVNIDDEAVAVLAELPISETLRLYGTQVSQAGIAKLKGQLDGIDIYGGRGGFLGVATGPLNTVVTMVTPNSGAQRGGIRINDRLAEINEQPIKNFEDLRRELGKFRPNDQIKVKLVRDGRSMEVKVTLTEDSG